MLKQEIPQETNGLEKFGDVNTRNLLLLIRSKKLITQRNSFAKDGLLGIDWIKFRLSVTGTSEGDSLVAEYIQQTLTYKTNPRSSKKSSSPTNLGMEF